MNHLVVAYEYNKYFTFMMLVSNWMVLFEFFFIVNVFELYIVQCRSSVYLD
jgi:hypothetical protein